MDVDMHIARRLRSRRRTMDLTQGQLAERVGVRFQSVGKWEAGECHLSASRLYDLSQALQVPVQFFFEGLPATQVAA